ncbi:MAG: Gfo/Idh/MocA family oxidoreductase [Bernardetiaceae bacterium]|jgi:predicted dehydrogenase|nr:Gfo/Idh/MocA family oxidoreductase [Bernardetiaceae bacterium]
MNPLNATTRRDFIKSAGTLATGVALAGPLGLNAEAQGRADTLKIGLVGCGGRGTGAASQALKADPNVVLTAMADIFPDHLAESLKNLSKMHPDKVKVDKAQQFVGMDAYQKLIESGVDVVLLATPPAFRPAHFEAAVKAGKHIFTEKPMAVDAPGVRRVLAASREAKKKNLAVVSGFCWRYDLPKRALFGKVLAGEIGQVLSIYNTYNTGPAWTKPRQSQWTEAEFQLRNWPHFNWLSGDHLIEQAVHSLDMMAWVMGDKTPLRATGTGGRQVSTGQEFGNCFDHFAIAYEYEGGAKGFHLSRKQQNCSSSYAVEVNGTKGQALVDVWKGSNRMILHDGTTWDYKDKKNDMYQTEHDELFASIRKGQPLNDGEWMCNSTLLAIMGRMVAYTGQTITWDEAVNAKETLVTDNLDLVTALKGNPLAQPGLTKFF